jgi:hypothetical protein
VNGLQRPRKEGEKGKERASKCNQRDAISTSQKLKYKRETHEMGVERKKEGRKESTQASK